MPPHCRTVDAWRPRRRDDGRRTGGAGAPARGRGYRAVVEWVVILMAVLMCTVVLRTYVVQSFYIPSGSMYPTLQVGDRIIVDKLSYRPPRRAPRRHRGLRPAAPRGPGVRRPGQAGHRASRARPSRPRTAHIYINGKMLDEPWLPPGSGQLHRAAPRRPPSPVRSARPGQDPAGRLLRDGGQPDRLRGQPVLRPHPEVADRGPGRGRGLARWPTSRASDDPLAAR